jgi:hypothetical protein
VSGWVEAFEEEPEPEPDEPPHAANERDMAAAAAIPTNAFAIDFNISSFVFSHHYKNLKIIVDYSFQASHHHFIASAH